MLMPLGDEEDMVTVPNNLVLCVRNCWGRKGEFSRASFGSWRMYECTYIVCKKRLYGIRAGPVFLQNKDIAKFRKGFSF